MHQRKKKKIEIRRGGIRELEKTGDSEHTQFRDIKISAS